MTPTEIGWEVGKGVNDRETLYIYAKDPRIKLWQRSSRVCDVFSKPTAVPFGDPAWWVSFMLTIDGRNPHGPYRTKDEAKAMAITLWRMT
jgi:hypothetical protein